MIKPRRWSKAGIYSLSAKKENRSKLLRLRCAIFSNHYRRPFVPPPIAQCKIDPQKQGQKSTATQKGKTRHLSEKAKVQPCPPS
jgi:hypothetical protein